MMRLEELVMVRLEELVMMRLEEAGDGEFRGGW
jgi:hypothetical protein